MKLDKRVRLERARGLSLHIGDDNEVQAEIAGARHALGPHALMLLEAFVRPRVLDDALSAIAVSGAQDWMDLAASAVRLLELGVLRSVDDESLRISAQAAGYEAWPIHAAMLGDRARTRSFLAGVAEVVRPGDVVVDIGTGTGILAIAAAKAGAARVFALEASGIADVARAVIAANGCAERVTVIEGLSTRLTLPERADVLVSEMIGNDPLGERVLEITADARRRLLVPPSDVGPRFVPRRVRVCALPVEIPDEELARRLGSPQTVRDWQAWYGIDFSPVAEAARGSNEPLFYLKPQHARDWHALHPGVELAEIDFECETPLALERSAEIVITEDGLLSGVLVYFELELGPTARLSSHPRLADARNHWRSPVWVPREPLALRAGDGLRIRFQYGMERRRSTLALERC